MSEFLIQKSPIKGNINEDSFFIKEKDDLFKVDLVKETLKRLRPRSKLKRNLAFILYKFYSCQISIIFISFITGFLTMGLPLLFIYNGLIRNIIIPFLIICVFGLIFSIVLIIVHIVDGKRNKAYLVAKWERKNILKNIGISFTLILLIISVSLAIKFYSNIMNYIDNEKIIIDYEQKSSITKELQCDYLFKYILNMIFISPSKIDDKTENNTILYYFSEDEIINILKKEIIFLLIPLLILSFNKIIKCFLIQVKYTIEQFIFFFGFFIFCIYNIIINNFKNETLINYNIDLISCFQVIIMGIIYIGYISWVFHYSIKCVRNPKDKNFAIREYKCFNVIIIILFDFISLFGATAIFISILYFYLTITFSDEIFKKLNLSFIFLKIGFLLTTIGNSYYFGHYLLSMIFRPISIQYAPYELKNNCYIKANRKLLNVLNTRKNGLKLKDVSK